MSPFCHSRRECIKALHAYLCIYSFWGNLGIHSCMNSNTTYDYFNLRARPRCYIEKDLIFRRILEFTYCMWISRQAKSSFPMFLNICLRSLHRKKEKKKTSSTLQLWAHPRPSCLSRTDNIFNYYLTLVFLNYLLGGPVFVNYKWLRCAVTNSIDLQWFICINQCTELLQRDWLISS